MVGGREKHTKAFAKLAQVQQSRKKLKTDLKTTAKHKISKLYTKPHLQNLAARLRNDLKQMDIREAKGAKIRAKICKGSERNLK